jgi:hypothetical protein
MTTRLTATISGRLTRHRRKPSGRRRYATSWGDGVSYSLTNNVSEHSESESEHFWFRVTNNYGGSTQSESHPSSQGHDYDDVLSRTGCGIA